MQSRKRCSSGDKGGGCMQIVILSHTGTASIAIQPRISRFLSRIHQWGPLDNIHHKRSDSCPSTLGSSRSDSPQLAPLLCRSPNPKYRSRSPQIPLWPDLHHSCLPPFSYRSWANLPINSTCRWVLVATHSNRVLPWSSAYRRWRHPPSIVS